MEDIKNHKKEIKKLLNYLFPIFFLIIDQKELKVSDFLVFKFQSNYRRDVIIRISLALTAIITYSIYILILEYPIVFIILIFFFFITDFFFEQYFYKRYKYSKIFYRKEKSRLYACRNALNLVLNNNILNENEEGEDSIKDLYKKHLDEVNKKVNYFGTIFRPYSYIIDRIGFISIILVLLTFAFNFLIYIILQQIVIDWQFTFEVIVPWLLSIIFTIFVLYNIIFKGISKMYQEERKIISIGELNFFVILELIKIRLRSLESIKGKKLSKEIISKFKKEKKMIY